MAPVAAPVDSPELHKSAAVPLTTYYNYQDAVTMAILEFKRQNVVEEIASTLQDDSDEVIEAIVVGKKKEWGVLFIPHLCR